MTEDISSATGKPVSEGTSAAGDAFWRSEALRWAEACGNAIGALQDAVPKLCKWCAEGEPISTDEDGVNRNGQYHYVRKWGIGLRPCSAVAQRKILDAIGGLTPLKNGGVK